MTAAATDVAARRMSRAAVRAEARRLRLEDDTLTFGQIGGRLGISQAAAWKYAGDIPRRCASCGSGFTPDRRSRVTTCPTCRDELAAERRAALERRTAARAALVCDECGDRLLVPAALCGFCDPDFDAAAALAALDAAATTR